MTGRGMRGVAVRTGLLTGLAIAAVTWGIFLACGGTRGMTLHGAPVPIAVFAAEVVLFAGAGFRLRRRGLDDLSALRGGLVAGLTSALLAGFPRGAILLLSDSYLRYLAGPHAGHVLVPWPPFAVLFALVGAVLAGAVLGAACGAIGGSFAKPSRT